MSGRAKWGLQASSLLSKRILRLNLGRRRLCCVVVEVVIKVELRVSGAVVVTIQMIIFRIEEVAGRDCPVRSEVVKRLKGSRIVEEQADIMVMKRLRTSGEVQGPRSSD